jgi:hypothetical protein
MQQLVQPLLAAMPASASTIVSFLMVSSPRLAKAL